MKKIIVLMIMVFSINSYSFDLDSILTSHGTSINELKQQGVSVVLGEFGGIGKAVSAAKLKALIAKNDLIFKQDIRKTNFRPGSKGKIADIKSVELLNGEVILTKSARGVLLNK